VRLERYQAVGINDLPWSRFMARKGRGAAATVEDIKGDVQELRDDLSALTEQMSELVKDGGGEALADVKKRIQRIRDNLEDVVTDKGHDAAKAVVDVTDDIGESLENALRTRPLTTLAIAVGIGFLFGSSWHHR
jgi:ElaB/YqjD/DUF883 family membrane-anchored ribosome-binding protein